MDYQKSLNTSRALNTSLTLLTEAGPSIQAGPQKLAQRVSPLPERLCNVY